MEILKFYQPSCTTCVPVSNYLEDQGVEVTSYNVMDSEGAKKAAELKIGYGVPVVILMDGDKEIKRTLKYNPAELEEIVNLYKAA
ncbi:thioredoxin [Priestia flexa]|uniref:glutaredoxin domain-containing protein n=1 Tax=Priestia TaxID=2800373 RepID=UPI0020A019D9|nr:glutaredoxin domain-containing protein [Priestia flexa]MCP1191377.1 thioredoxin [Priestia flexa]